MEDGDRRQPRYQASWSVRLWLSEGLSLVGRAVDVGVHGMQIALLTWVPSGVVQLGERYRLDVDAGVYGMFTRFAEARHVSSRSIGFEIAEPLLPVEVAVMQAAGYGDETLVPSPLAEIVNVPSEAVA